MPPDRDAHPDPVLADAALVARVGAGDSAACRSLMETHLGRVHAFAWRMLGDAAEAEDVAQEAFLRLWRQVGKWRAEARVGTWLHRVAHNLFLGGAIASAWLVKRQYGGLRPPPTGGMAGDFDFRGGLAALGGEARPLARDIRREYGPRLREAGKAMHDTRREVGGLLRADAIDPAALDKALAELRVRSDEAQAVMHEVLMEAMRELTPEQRRTFLKAAMQRGPRGDHRPLPGGTPPEGPPEN